MIKTKRIKSINCKLPSNTNNEVYVNILTWHDKNHKYGSEYNVFSPYYLKTDGNEENLNNGGVIFENFWQGSKIFPKIYDIEVWAHPSLRGNLKHLWWSYKCSNGQSSELHFVDNEIKSEYYKWREKVFSSDKPIRYPNGVKRKSNVAFSLTIDKNGNEKRLSYIEARKEIYFKEYCRLVKDLPQFQKLIDFYKDGKTIVLCEIDVPDNEIITMEKLKSLIEDPKIRFGHGLCLAWILFEKLQN
ncbi:unnamed protein product [Brachionus calyciflorus]|uniref:Uncharacterized protein n=1 Tax=Brachionus calyciflorus TaxID=104777 RepID=A0A814J3T6_9BILA|nr:unnamed protein product [Brachionus calyciflorus]